MNSLRNDKYISYHDIEFFLKKIRQPHDLVVTLNGCFDLFHRGHLEIITHAANLGSILIVALNEDDSIKKAKGPSRPIFSLQDRILCMGAIGCVDYVTSFPEDNPIKLLEKIRPNIHVNGEEYGMNCIESQTVRKYGGKIHLVPKLPGLSTSQIIDKIQKCD